MRSVVNRIHLPEHRAPIEIREPRDLLHRWKTGAGAKWHTDAISRLGTKSFVLLWSNECPTEIRNKKTLQRKRVRNGDIVLFDNELFEHRISRRKPRKRWFARHLWGIKNWKRRGSP
jgi:hypothetical protein